MKMHEKGYWNPMLAGTLSGLLALVSVVVAGKFLGASTTFVRAAGLLESLIDPSVVERLAYYQSKVPKFDWQFLFVIGIFFGALLAAKTSGTYGTLLIPERWKNRFGTAYPLRAFIGFIGGVIAIFGARLAGGCPSGHGLSGLTQMSVSGFIAAACFFLGGILSARLLYGRRK